MNIKDLIESLDYMVKAELTPFIWGHAGIGKSSVAKQYAEKKGYLFFPFYLGTQADIGDILGLQDFVKDEQGNTVAVKHHPPEWLKKMIDYCHENPESGAVIFLDEFNRARRDILNGMFSLALDKTFHTLKLPKNCHVIAAGNPPTDEYFVTDVNETALMARFVHIKLEPTFDEWMKYAQSKSIDHTLLDFLKNQPELLEQNRTDFELPVKVDRRSYERLDKLFKLKTPKHLLEGLMFGIIGLERTVAYQNYLSVAEKPLEGAAILDAANHHILEKWSNPENIISSLLNITCENLKTWLFAQPKNLSAPVKAELMRVMATVPKDISFPLIADLCKKENAVFKDFYMDKLYCDRMVSLVRASTGREAPKL